MQLSIANGTFKHMIFPRLLGEGSTLISQVDWKDWSEQNKCGIRNTSNYSLLSITSNFCVFFCLRRRSTMSKICKIHARQIFDSRGNPTVEVDLTTDKGIKLINYCF